MSITDSDPAAGITGWIPAPDTIAGEREDYLARVRDTDFLLSLRRRRGCDDWTLHAASKVYAVSYGEPVTRDEAITLATRIAEIVTAPTL